MILTNTDWMFLMNDSVFLTFLGVEINVHFARKTSLIIDDIGVKSFNFGNVWKISFDQNLIRLAFIFTHIVSSIPMFASICMYFKYLASTTDLKNSFHISCIHYSNVLHPFACVSSILQPLQFYMTSISCIHFHISCIHYSSGLHPFAYVSNILHPLQFYITSIDLIVINLLFICILLRLSINHSERKKKKSKS